MSDKFGQKSALAYQPRSLGFSIGKAANKALRQRGFAVAEVLTRWPAIVGEQLARHSSPERLTFPTGKPDGATLRLRVAAGFAPEVQHLAPLIIERLNTFYGYRAVDRLKIIQGPIPPPAAQPERVIPPLDQEGETQLAALTQGIEDPRLRDAVARLGRSLLAGPAK